MGEPVKKVAQSPESYSPKDRPIIIDMAEIAAERNAAPQRFAVQAMEDGAYIDGVPMLNWGEWKDNTYCGAIAMAAKVMGIPVSYEYLMGVSGLCYRFAMRANWCPGAALAQNSRVWDENIHAAMGIALYSVSDETQRDQMVMDSIDAGRPVLCMGQIGSPEWGLITGYAENGRTFFGRSYFDAQNIDPGSPFFRPDNIFHTENNYRRAVDYPGTFPEVFLKFFDRTCGKKQPLELLKNSLENCLAYSTHVEANDCMFGEAAYQILIDGLLKEDELYNQFRRNENYHVGVLTDARRSAWMYLEGIAALMEGPARRKILDIAALYRTLCDGVLAVMPYAALSREFAFNAGPKEAWDRETRVRLASALQEAVRIERSVQDIVKDILSDFED